MHDQLYVFPDTNILLHFPPMADLDWCGQCNARSVTIVYCITVIEELDDKKANPRFGTRANRAIKDLRASHKSGSSLRENVKVEIYNRPFRQSEFDGSLSPDSNDDRIIHFAKKYVEENPGFAVAIVTEDFGMEVRCDGNDIDVIRIDPTLRLEDPADELTKKFRKAVAENEQLKNRQPRLELQIVPCGDKPSKKPMPFQVRLSRSWDVLDVESEVAEQRRKHPKHGERRKTSDPFGLSAMDLAASFAGPGIAPQEWNRYNEKLDKYFGEYEQYVIRRNQWNELQARCFDFDVWLVNTGGAPATDIDVDLTFPACLSHVVDNDAQNDSLIVRSSSRTPRCPHPPVAPERPKLKILGGYSDLDRTLLPRFNSPSIPVMDRKVEISDAEGGILLHSHARHLKQGYHPWKVGSFWCGFVDWSDVNPFQLQFSITACELPPPLAGAIPIKATLVAPSDEAEQSA